jgi:hypothetical protein
LTTIRKVGAVGIALGLGLGLTAAWPALASDHGWSHGSDDHSSAWGVHVAGDDGPAWGLTVTGHGPAWGVHVDEDNSFSLPVVLDAEGPIPDWSNGTSAFGIDDASITGDNPVADAYLGQPGFNSLTGWTNDRQGWLGGLLGDDGWGVVGGLF